MTTAAQKLESYGITMAQANAWLVANVGDPAYVLSVCAAAGLTNAMIGEIAGYPGAAVPAGLVIAFFDLQGLDSRALDTPTVVSVSGGSAGEGGFVQHTVTLSGPTVAPTEFALALNLGGADIGDFTAYSATAGISFASANSILVPAGVSSFSLRLDFADDAAVESAETYTLQIGGVSGTGTINDNDAAVVPPELTGFYSDPGATEGDTVIHVVQLASATTGVTVYPFNFLHQGGDASTWGAITATQGVQVSSTQVTVPAGVTGFEIHVATVEDSIVESGNNWHLLTLGELQSTGAAMDDDVAGATVQSVTSVQATEGSNLVFTVNLSRAEIDEVEGGQLFGFNLSGTTAAASDFSSPITLSNGVTMPFGNDFKVPAGVSSFTVTVPTTNDSADEPNETVTLIVDGQSGVGTILDNDDPAPVGSLLLPTPIDGFAPTLDLNDRTGDLSTLTLRTKVLDAIADDSKYWSLFDPAKYGKPAGGTFTAAELGVSHLGDLPATAETIESLYYGTFLDISLAIDFAEAGAISTFFFANLAAIFAHSMPATGQYVALLVDAEADPVGGGGQAHPEGALANSMPTGMIGATTNPGLQENIFWGLLNI